MHGLLEDVYLLSRNCPEKKTVLVRVDFNVPVKLNDSGDLTILDHRRIVAHRDTVSRLVDCNNKVVLVSHQGRPGTSDFTELEKHAEVASRLYGMDIKWLPDVAGPYALDEIGKMGRGQVVLLDNIRLYSEELIEAPPSIHARSLLVRRLSSVVDFYVNDAFATAHRSHASIVGFPYVRPGLAGLLMEKELTAVSMIFDPSVSPKLFILGGGKVHDTLRIIENLFRNRVAERILTGGLVAELFLVAKGINLGQPNLELLESMGILSLVPRARNLLLKGAPVETPVDFITIKNGAVSSEPVTGVTGLIRDIGPETRRMYRELIRGAALVVLRGPMGVVEEPRFRQGTFELIKGAIDTSSFTIIGGGHINVLVEGIELNEKRVHTSTGGAALLTLLSGEPLPALQALRLSKKKFTLGG